MPFVAVSDIIEQVKSDIHIYWILYQGSADFRQSKLYNSFHRVLLDREPVEPRLESTQIIINKNIWK